ncbi:coiled-coil domain-containing protein 117 [Rhineura floridana]|uniref:coiled-coil domain-containing protein 117 n=1 Tax=Rhineura floridana TaxID=261503 RepID=UPI002AC817F8|nr:coiled-coil domain-containing protein 117 [Rhineura floridana]
MAALEGAFQGGGGGRRGAGAPLVEFLQGPPASPDSPFPAGGPPSALDGPGSSCASSDGATHRRPDLYLPPPPPRASPLAPERGAPPVLLPQKSRPRAPACCRKKHKMDEEPDDCPVGKKRWTEAGLGSTAPGAEWTGLSPQGLNHLPCPPEPLEIPCEEMEQTMGELQCEAARRKLQEIEERIIDEDEDSVLTEGSVSTLPTLILSDTLKTGLKKDYEGVLTKKIIESMSRPSMELVLWKPLPEFLTERAKPVSVKNYTPLPAQRCPAKPAALEGAFLPQREAYSEQPQQEMTTSTLYGTLGPSGGADEEMEL